MKTRDGWLAEITPAIAKWVDDLDFPLPKVEVKSGFPSTGRRATETAESWEKGHDGSYVIFVRPDRSDPVEVAAAVAQHMCRIATFSKDRGDHLFRYAVEALGLKVTKGDVIAGPEFEARIKPLIDKLGKMPCPDMAPTTGATPPKQTTRQIKVYCEKCGYVARVSRKWLNEVGPPHCPKHGPMKPDL